MTTTPEQIEAVARAMCDTEWGEGYWDELMPYARREYKRQAASAISAMRPFIRAEVLEEAADVVGEVGDCAEAGAYITAIRALKDKP
jgi:hypothetical protein